MPGCLSPGGGYVPMGQFSEIRIEQWLLVRQEGWVGAVVWGLIEDWGDLG